MTIGAIKPFTITLASGITASSALDLGGGYNRVMVGIPTMTSGTDICIQASDSENGTFRRIYMEPKVDSSAPVVFQVASSITNCFVPVNIAAQFLKIEFTTACEDSGHSFKILCSTN